MAKATWNGAVLAESGEYEMVEGNVYFPPSTLNMEYFEESRAHTECHWKGTASYYNIVVGEEVNKDAAWYYPDPKEAASNIKGYVAFWRGVTIEK